MTAILGYACVGKDGNFGESLLIADDFMSGANVKADKIVLLGSRFAVAVVGSAELMNCMGILEPFCRSGHHAQIDSVEALGATLREVTSVYASHIRNEWKKAIESGQMKESKLREAEGMLSSCVVLDCQEHCLWFITCGSLYAEEGVMEKFPIKQLDDGTIYCFSALSSNRSPYHAHSRGSGLPWDLAKGLFADAKNNSINKVGDIGASVECQGKNIKFTSCFKSPVEYIEAFVRW
jgi:hypothetical protein